MLVFDIETDGLLSDVTKLHCLAVGDTETEEIKSYDDKHSEEGVKRLYEALKSGRPIAGHNVINYDIPVLTKLFSWFRLEKHDEALIFDTLVAARLIYSNIETIDLGYIKRQTLPPALYKSQRLEAWGYRLGLLKGDYGKKENAWNAYTDEMLRYCVQDVRLTMALYEKLTRANYSAAALILEHKVAWLMAKQERNGFPFDKEAAERLEAKLRAKKAVIDHQLMTAVPPIPDKIFIPKRDNKTRGYKAGVPIQRFKAFNPGSRKQIEYLIRTLHCYEPTDSDLYDIPDGATVPDLSEYRLKIDEATFAYIESDEAAPKEVRTLAALLSRDLLIGKRLGQLADGKHAWLKEYNEKTGCIHGRVITNGTVSGRAAHASPNVAQVPANGSPYGKECRALFNAGDWWEVGIDVSGLELRCLAHYLTPYDGGTYGDEILHGDIHTKNQKAAGLPTRDAAKRFVYALLYGAGDLKIGKIIGGDETDGKRIKRKFYQATPAMKELKAAITDALADTERGRVVHWKRRYLKGLDGRLLYVRSIHSALNLLLQSAGAVICKDWIVRTEERLIAKGFNHGWDGDFAYMLWCHDEIQAACRTKEIADTFIEEAISAIHDTEKALSIRVPLDAEGKIGKNWSNCH